MADEEPVSITNADVQDFAQRLQSWGAMLPSKDRALLQLLMARAQGTGEGDVEAYSIPSIEAATMSALGPMVKSGMTARQPRAWVELGPAWVETIKA
jgi:hypothetical protein